MDSIKLIYLTIFSGAILLAVGGLVATWGWNRLAGHNQRINLIKGISREIDFNVLFRETQPRLFDAKDSSALAEEGFMPKFRNVATRSALSSGALDDLDEELIDQLMRYEWTIDYVNRALGWVEMERVKVGGHPIAESIRRSLLESPTYSEYLKAEVELKSFLETNFREYIIEQK